MGTTVTNSPTPQTKSPATTDAADTNVAAPAGKQTPTPPQKPQEDPQAAANAAKASKQNANERKSQQDMRGQVAQKNLHKQVPTVDKKPAAAPTTDATGLKAGQSISAKVTEKRDGFHFEFERPVTKEQAAAIIFKNGKLPSDAKLVQGPGNSWVVQVPGDMDARQNTLRHFNSRTETVSWKARGPNEYPDRELTATWVGGALKTSSTGPKRHDLQNDFGFKIFRNYKLDEGQRPTGHLGESGRGYEVSFEKPMTKAEVMDKLIDKRKITHGEVKLVPIGQEPSMLWKVEVIGVDAMGAWKHPVGRAFMDASNYAKEELPSGAPAGLRGHFENKTIPKDAVKHPPDVYVWEQDGHMVYVKTNNKGKDGYYEPQVTKMPTDEQGKIWMRYYMKEKGMPPREAWKNFWNDTLEVAKMQGGMISGAGRTPRMPKGGPIGKPTITNTQSGGGRVPTTKPSVKVNTPSVSQKSKTDIGTAKTQDAPPPPPKPPAGGRGTVADSQPPVPNRKPGDMSKSEIDAENASVAGYKPPKFRPSPGDGTKINIDDAFAELRKKNGQVLESGSHDFHRNAWQNWLGQKGEPPLAFRVGGKIRIDVERLSPDQRRRFVELEKAQAAAIKK